MAALELADRNKLVATAFLAPESSDATMSLSGLCSSSSPSRKTDLVDSTVAVFRLRRKSHCLLRSACHSHAENTET